MFAEAVGVIERFLVPFECWSLLDFGLYGNDDSEKTRLAMIDTPAKARALLTLLDRSVGQAEGAVVPYDLGQALAHIKQVSSEPETPCLSAPLYCGAIGRAAERSRP